MSRINIFVGHYGSGKTEIAINYAFKLKEQGKSVTLVDLDIVNPYFCSRELKELLESKGIKLISSEPSLSNAELMVIPAEVLAVFNDKTSEVIFDVGGDETGAVALGRYNSYFKEENYEMYFVMNSKRPLTNTSIKAETYLREIEKSSRLKVSGIISNTNLSYETSIEDIINGEKEAIKLSNMLNIPIKFTSVRKDLEPSLQGILKSNILPIKIYMKPFWR